MNPMTEKVLGALRQVSANGGQVIDGVTWRRTDLDAARGDVGLKPKAFAAHIDILSKEGSYRDGLVRMNKIDVATPTDDEQRARIVTQGDISETPKTPVATPPAQRKAQRAFDAWRKKSGKATFMLSPGQCLMIEDGAPMTCFLSDEERAQWWIDHPPTKMPKFAHEKGDNLTDHDKVVIAQLIAAEQAPKKREVDEEKVAKKAERKVKHEQRQSQRDGLVDAAAVGKELGVTAREVRAALRAAKAKKPEHGWAWPAKEVPAIKRLIKSKL